MNQSVVTPTQRPTTGLTVAVKSVEICPAQLLVRLSSDVEIAIQLANCFPRDRDRQRWSLAEQALMESAIAAAGSNLLLTLPIPRRSPAWWQSLNRKDQLFAGYLWVDETTTLQQILIDSGSHQSTPSLPIKSMSEQSAPLSRPPAGLTAACKVLACDGAADTWWIQFDAAFEIQLRLIDCYTGDIRSNPDAYIVASKAIDTSPSLTCTLPTPVHQPGKWFNELRTGSQQAGWLWLHYHDTLNQILVSKGFAEPKLN